MYGNWFHAIQNQTKLDRFFQEDAPRHGTHSLSARITLLKQCGVKITLNYSIFNYMLTLTPAKAY